MSTGKQARETEDPKVSAAKAVVDRVNRARGNYLARTGVELDWPDFGRKLEWAPATITDIKSGKRPLRVLELDAIAKMLEVSPGFLAFGEGQLTLGESEPKAPESEAAKQGTVELVNAAAQKKLRQRQSQTGRPAKPRHSGRGRSA